MKTINRTHRKTWKTHIKNKKRKVLQQTSIKLIFYSANSNTAKRRRNKMNGT